MKNINNTIDPSDETKILRIDCGIPDIPQYFRKMYCTMCDKQGNIEGEGIKGKCRRLQMYESTQSHGLAKEDRK